MLLKNIAISLYSTPNQELMNTTIYKTSDYLTTDEIHRMIRYFRKVGNIRMSLLIEFGIIGFLLLVFGFSLGAFPLVFVIGKESNPLYLVGTAIAFINASEALFDAITEPLIRNMLDIINHGSNFSVQSYKLALTILPIYQIIGAVLLQGVTDKNH